MRLIKIWETDLKKAYVLQNCFELDENGFINGAYGLSFEAFKNYVKERKDHSMGLNLPEGHVPDTVFILEDKGQYVGIFNLRHELNEFLKNGAGHIGYGIAPDFRKRGYATKGLALVLQEAKKLGIDVAYLSCYKGNIGSLKAMLNNGAVIDHEDEKEYYTRIKC